jgi:hypothetical protein
MKKIIYMTTFILTFSLNVHCFKKFVEKVDYFVNFSEKSPEMAAVLHVNFANVLPKPKEAEEIVKQQLRAYGSSAVVTLRNNKSLTTVKEEIKHKNIIGSAWYYTNNTSHNPIKIKFEKDMASYVWLGKTGKIVTFHNYMQFLKKEKSSRKL